MSKVEEIERAVEQLPPRQFAELAAWLEKRRRQIESSQPSDAGSNYPPPSAAREDVIALRDHSAFLNSYAPEDEGLYDDAAAG